MCFQRLPVRQLVAILSDEQAQLALETSQLFHGRDEFVRCPEGALGTISIENGEVTNKFHFREYARGTTRAGFYVSLRRRASVETGAPVGRKLLFVAMGREGSGAFAATVLSELQQIGVEQVSILLNEKAALTHGQMADLFPHKRDAFPLDKLMTLVGEPIAADETRTYRGELPPQPAEEDGWRILDRLPDHKAIGAA